MRKVKEHTTLEAVLAGIVTADDLAGNDLADAACKVVVLAHRSPPNIREARLRAISAVTRMAHWIARVGSARERLDIDSTWLPGRGCATARQGERERPWPLPLPALPTIWRRGHTFVDNTSGRTCAGCQHPERATRGRCPGAAGAGVRDAAQRLRLDGSAGHRNVDLLQGGKVVSVICVVCGSYGGRVVRKSLLDRGTWNSATWKAAGSARRVVWFPAWFQPHCTTRQCSCGNLACLVWTMSHQGAVAFSAQLPFVAAVLRDVLTSLRLTSPSSTFPSASRELARAVSTAGSAADDDASSDEELPGHSNNCQGTPTCGAPSTASARCWH